MKKIFSASLLILVALYTAGAQELPRTFVSLGLSAGKTEKLNIGSMPVTFSHQIAGISNFRYQLGLRQNLAFGATSFTVNNRETYIDDLSNYSINVFAGLEYISSYKLLVGFNIDLLGATIGTRSYKTIGSDPVYSVSPEVYNIMLGGSDDKGSLNSEFYLGYRVNDNITVKAGLSRYLLSLEYQNTRSKGITQSYLNIPFIKIEYVLWQKQNAE